MAERDRASEASNDPEIQAMTLVRRAMAPLDRSARNRVLEWAQGRYVREALPALDPQFMTKFTDELAAAARQMGDVTPLDIIRAANEFAKHREDSAEAEEVAAQRER